MNNEQQLSRAGESAARRPLSANEEFMCAFDRGNDFGVFGPRGIVLAGWRLHGQLDMTTLRLALNDVVARHEALRTAIIRDKDDVHARVYPPCPAELTVVDLSSAVDEADRERRAHTFLNEVGESGRIDVTQMPLLCAVLGQFDDDDAVLVLVTHHTVSDAWSVLSTSGVQARAEVVVLGGEAISVQVAADIRAALHGVRIVNIYGPTEAKVFVLDEGLRLAPVGVAGEL